MAGKPNNARKQAARAGDATGKERDRLAKENAPAIAQAAAGMSMVNPTPRVEAPEEVIDYSAGGHAAPGNHDQIPVVGLREAIDKDTAVANSDLPEDDVDIEALPTGQSVPGQETLVDRAEEPQPAHGARRDSRRQVQEIRTAPLVEKAFRLLRVNTDLEDITIGKDQHYTFLENKRYKVPAHVYDHLDEKGYVYH